MAKLDDLFKLMVTQGASDLHLAAGAPPYLRLHGEMMKLEYRSLTNEEVQALIFEIITEKGRKQFSESWELDTSYTLEGVARFRCNIFMQRKGMGGVFRVIPDRIKSVEELGLPSSLLDMIATPKGLICVTGPTGSGKSTTLAALIDFINTNEKAHILTIEDPIEFVHQNKKSLVNQREVSSHTRSFANALKASLREDPDIILVGEMRDLETIQLALTAAETGHLVFGTLHTNNAHKTIDRIIDVFPEGKQAQIRTMLSESLRGVIAQSLLPRADKPGRIAAIEVMLNTKAIANLIREGKTFQIPSSMQTGKREGMVTYDNAVEELVRSGRITQQVGAEFLGKTTASATSANDQAGKGAPGTQGFPITGAAGTRPPTAPMQPMTPQTPMAPQTPQAPQSSGGVLGNLLKKTS